MMSSTLQENLKLSVQTADELYHRLVLLVGEHESGKTTTLQALAKDLGAKVVNVNLELSRVLLELSVRQRAMRVGKMLEDITSGHGSPVILDNLEILFDKTLNQDPLRTLQGISRNRTVVVSWNGTMSSGRLLYAESGHPEYRSYDSVDALIVGIDGSATVDSVKKQ